MQMLFGTKIFETIFVLYSNVIIIKGIKRKGNADLYAKTNKKKRKRIVLSFFIIMKAQNVNL